MRVSLPEAELESLCVMVASALEAKESPVSPSAFIDNLVGKILRRYLPLQEFEDAAFEAEGEEGDAAKEPVQPSLVELPGGAEAAVAFVVKELHKACRSPYFALAERVSLKNDSDAVKELMALLDRNLRLKGILFRYRLNPEEEHPAIWSRVWEAIPKWDGRDFRAYVARIVRNHCLDEIARKKKSPGTIEDDPRDGRPGRAQTGSQVASRDALSFVMGVLDELEASGRIKALDGVIFGLISQGRSVADVVESFRATPVLTRFIGAFEVFGGTTTQSHAVTLRFLLDGLTPAETARLTQSDEGEIGRVANALGAFESAGEKLLAKTLARPGLKVKDLERAQRLTTNAINLCINRIRLKVWMGLVDRAYEAMRRRGRITETELAIVQQRCTQSPPAGCRMYKDRSCKREADADDIARRAGLDMDGAAVGQHMDELRRKLIEEGLGLVFPDYNACLIERKPIRRRT